MNFYDTFIKLCNNKGISPSRAAQEMGCSKTMVSNWKTRGTHPTAANLTKIAEYFGVPVSYFDGEPSYTFDLQLFGETPQEKKLVEIYRALDEVGRAKLLIYADELLQ